MEVQGLGALKLVLRGSHGGESLMCCGDGATKSRKMSVHEKCLEQGKTFIDLGKEVHIYFLERGNSYMRRSLNEARNSSGSKW